ncbi:MAG: GTP-binding protein [bacterium]
MKQTQLILVGGFLGAGKTTLLARAAMLLIDQGKRVGLITNDQAADLVDTALLRQADLNVQEIAGGCFCCRFGQLIDTAQQIIDEISPDIIIGEPVGSCTDLAATVLQPIKDLYADTYKLTPFSVLVDPNRLWEVLEPRRQSTMHASARYILRKQLEEADIIVINKKDLLDDDELQELKSAANEKFPGKSIQAISALIGDGVAKWLRSVMADDAVGTHIVDVDYNVYAEGEAILGWLNASAKVTAATKADWKEFSLDLLNKIQQVAASQEADIAHVKLSLTAPTGQYVANLTSTTGTPAIRGEITGNPQVATLVINARVEMTPEKLQAIIEDTLNKKSNENLAIQIETIRSLSPGRPTPTHRYTSVV